ncbi:VOC family protein [Paenibacillus pinihumi]|uniref:VOC family protein n=1 Tax=Paenibacillus pinihumi TaxID=669462 RepID=UPI00041E64C9|nr:hypothetical protein [Paenibacillus pinihumi]
MITHFEHLQLHTVSIQGVKRFYHDQLHIPVAYESDREITLQLSEHTHETGQPLSPVHLAFEVPYSEFDHVVDVFDRASIALLKWPDGRKIDNYATGRNFYFRDGDGNLLEIIAHPYVKEGILPAAGETKVLYLREIGFPVDSVIDFRNLMVEVFDFKLDKVADDFSFAIGGTAHMVIVSKQRKWIPIAMRALVPPMKISFGASSSEYMNKIRSRLAEKDIPYESETDGTLHFKLYEYEMSIRLSDFPAEAPALLNLPFSNK